MKLKTLLAVAAILIATLPTSAVQAEVEVVLQCGPATIVFVRDATTKLGWKAVKSSGLPNGAHPITVKDDTIYVDDKPCKEICKASAERQC